MNKTILYSVIALVLSLTVVGVTPLVFAPKDDPNEDPDPTNAAQARRFHKVAEILDRAIARYDKVVEDLAGTGPSDDPAVITAVQDIIDKANSLSDKASDLLTTPCNSPPGCTP